MAKKKNKFYNAWHWLMHHPYFKDNFFEYFEQSLLIEVVKVNPKTLMIDDDASKNTKIRIWLECGAPILDEKEQYLNGETYHDIKLDTGGDTFEEAIINLTKLVKKEYGDYRIYT